MDLSVRPAIPAKHSQLDRRHQHLGPAVVLFHGLSLLDWFVAVATIESSGELDPDAILCSSQGVHPDGSLFKTRRRFRGYQPPLVSAPGFLEV